MAVEIEPFSKEYDDLFFLGSYTYSVKLFNKLKLKVPNGIFSPSVEKIYLIGNTTSIKGWVEVINHEFFHKIIHDFFGNIKPFKQYEEELIARKMTANSFKVTQLSHVFIKKLQKKLNGKKMSYKDIFEKIYEEKHNMDADY